jgi:hypothetical protein
MTERRPEPSGQGESGPSAELETRRVTEEAARTGRFPDEHGVLRDDSSPLEPETEPETGPSSGS